jgi:UDP-N-acetylmuramate--alanine ligase
MGEDPVFIVEADESDGSFLQYPTRIAVVTGIEVDHLDNWGTQDHYAQGFEDFASAATVGTVILNGDDPGARRLGESLVERGRPVMTFGQTQDCDVRITEVNLRGNRSEALLVHQNWSTPLCLSLPGLHNLYNAAAAFCVGIVLGVDRARVVEGLSGFHGTARRFQVLGVRRGIQVVDDYAHHPTEVVATLAAAREVAGDSRVIACFQPHLYSRTKAFADEFGAALAQADEVVVLDVYPAREEPIPGVSGELVAQAVERHHGRAYYVPSMDNAAATILPLATAGDLILTIGAGSVTTLGPQLLEELQ